MVNKIFALSVNNIIYNKNNMGIYLIYVIKQL